MEAGSFALLCLPDLGYPASSRQDQSSYSAPGMHEIRCCAPTVTRPRPTEAVPPGAAAPLCGAIDDGGGGARAACQRLSLA